MKVIIAGGRDYQMKPPEWDYLDGLNYMNKFTEVVSGGAKGADEWGEYWAKSRGIPVKRFPADWDKEGKRAGPIRNKKMAEYADAAILFPGGKGTANMLQHAKNQKLRIFITPRGTK